MLCVLILYIIGETYSLTSNSNERFFEQLFMGLVPNENIYRVVNGQLALIFMCVRLCMDKGKNSSVKYLQVNRKISHELKKIQIIGHSFTNRSYNIHNVSTSSNFAVMKDKTNSSNEILESNN